MTHRERAEKVYAGLHGVDDQNEDDLRSLEAAFGGVAADEREACAKLAESFAGDARRPGSFNSEWDDCSRAIAAAIRREGGRQPDRRDNGERADSYKHLGPPHIGGA